MSSAVISASAALSRSFVFETESSPEAHPDLYSGRPPQPARLGASGNLVSPDPKLFSIVPASRLEVRPAPEMAHSGIPAIDALTGGLPRGCLTEICGPTSSGRTTVLLAALAAATQRGEFCVIVDASDALDPYSAAAAGVALERLLWVRCGETSQPRAKNKSQAAFKFTQTNPRPSEHCLEQLLRASDLLLESGGFGLIALDLCDVPLQAARRIPLTTWFRFRRAVEHKPTILLAFEPHPIAGNCSSLLLKLSVPSSQFSVLSSQNNSQQNAGIENDLCDDDQAAKRTKAEPTKPAHAQLLTGLDITVELIRSRFGNSPLSRNSSSLSPSLARKPAASVSATFVSKTAWAG